MMDINEMRSIFEKECRTLYPSLDLEANLNFEDYTYIDGWTSLLFEVFVRGLYCVDRPSIKPIKVIYPDESYNISCTCNNLHLREYHKYCVECGSKLDWEDFNK
jgi:hypothetical protein